MAVTGASGQPAGSGGAVARAVTSGSVSPGPGRPLRAVAVTTWASGGGTGDTFARRGVRTVGGGVRVTAATGRRVHDVVVGVGIDLFGAALGWTVGHDVMPRSLRTREGEL